VAVARTGSDPLELAALGLLLVAAGIFSVARRRHLDRI